jgi:hypothetical protein
MTEALKEALERKQALLAPALRITGLTSAGSSGETRDYAPILVTIRKAVEISGLSRSTIYVRAKAGELTLKKAGKTTLVDYASLRMLLDRLPTAQLKNAA